MPKRSTKKRHRATKPSPHFWQASTITFFGLLAVIVGTALYWRFGPFFTVRNGHTQAAASTQPTATNGSRLLPPLNTGKFRQLATNLQVRSIPLEEIVSGGPGKDGIPALTNPPMVPLTEIPPDRQGLGILITDQDEARFYPLNILVWHEIVNDQIGDTPYAVTFCPLCGSAIVFDRRVDAQTVEMGVSGLLWESNLLMYDSATESLWSQALGTAVVGDMTGTTLTILPFDRISFATLRSQYPDALVLSENTGFKRNYRTDPYSGYENDARTYFPVSVQDDRFFAKDLFYVVPYQGRSTALPIAALETDQTATLNLDGSLLTAQRQGDAITVTDAAGNILPGYYEMWFSWATHHQATGIVWEIE